MTAITTNKHALYETAVPKQLLNVTGVIAALINSTSIERTVN